MSSLPGSVLIVDDNSENIQALADILRTNGYKVGMAKTGVRALKFVTEKKPDVILLDIMMPEMDGFEVCSRLKQDQNTKDIPVIFISALTETVDKVRGFETGGVDYVTKPFQKEEILARVKTHIELKRSREELKEAYQKLEIAYRELEIAARTDSVTHLPNRRDMMEKLKYERNRADRNGTSFALILGDIDNFKLFNDTYGHDCGDFVLMSVANLMRMAVREQDTVARWGGEEFLLLLPETDLEGGRIVAEKIRQRLCNTFYNYEHHRFNITMTFGISSFSQIRNVEKCIRRADEALYKGKRSGKNCTVVSEESAEVSEQLAAVSYS